MRDRRSALVRAAEGGEMEAIRLLVEGFGVNVNAEDNNGWTAFMLAVRAGHIEVAQFLALQGGANVYVRDNNNRTALMLAAEGGHAELVSFLVKECDASIYSEDSGRRIALMLAVEEGRVALCRFLKKECDVNIFSKDSRRQIALMLAAEGDHVELVRLLVEGFGVNVNAEDNNGWTAFMLAVRAGHVGVAQFLALQGGANVYVRDNNNRTALMLAAEGGHVELVRFLVKACHANMDSEDSSGRTALMLGAEGGHVELVRILVEECGVNVNAKDNNGWTAFMLAIRGGHIEVARILTASGHEDVNAIDNNKRTALMRASEKGHLEMVRFLVGECDTDVNAQDNEGRSALMLAAEGGLNSVVQFLAVEGRGDVEAKDKNNRTASMLAAAAGHLEVIRFLVKERGVNVNSKDNNERTMLMFAAAASHIEVVHFLVEECSVDVNAQDNNGESSLMRAAAGGHISIIRRLMSQGRACVNATDKNERTALMRAATGGHLEMTCFLVNECGANMNAKDSTGWTALMQAVRTGHISVARFLTASGHEDVNAIDNNKRTALMRASEKGHLKMVRFLVGECDADVNAKDNKGRTSLMLAAEGGFMEVARFLLEKCGVYVNGVDVTEWTALIFAANRGHVEVARFLVKVWSAAVDVMDNKGRIALMFAAAGGHIEMTRFLAKECDANVNAKDNNGWTALMFAIDRVQIKVIRFLVEECDAQINIKNNDGWTAIRLAADRGYYDIRRLLTRFVSPGRELPTGDTTGFVVHKRASSHGSVNCSIPPSEIVLGEFCENGEIGGDFRAKWLDADAIVKLFVPDASHSSFEQEVRVWQELRHPNVLRLYGACYAGPQLQLFVCEYASKGSLAQYVNASSSSSEGKSLIWTYLHQAALGLAYLHERGIVHGDLRCGNILIGSDSIAKLSDFELIDSQHISSLKERVGSMCWQSPEVVEGSPPSFKSDVYSLGMCILEAETGTIPWGGDKWARDSKLTWEPELDGGDDDDSDEDYCYSSGDDSPNCPFGDARELVWRMCSNDPYKRATLSSIVYALEHLSIQERSGSSQPETEPPSCFDDYASGTMIELWNTLQEYMEEGGNVEYRPAFDKLKHVHECLHESKQKPFLLKRFCSLLTDFDQTVRMPPERARIMRLSSTRATKTCPYALDWRMEALLAALGESASKATEPRWQQQRSAQIAAFVSGVSDTFLVLQGLKSMEERSAFLRLLKTEMENTQVEYTPEQLQTMKKAYEEITSRIETEGDLTTLTPDWFIPWYELVVDEWELLGRGGFGSVYRAKWLDSDVVVKQVILPGSTGSSKTVTWSGSCWGVQSESTQHVDDSKRKEAVAMFRSEVDIWFGLSHPHVVRLFGACHVGRPFFVCEYATHGTLVSYLREHPDELWTKLHEAALGVQYLHARGVVHGDLKGNNIVIGSDLKAKVTDFGLSSRVTSEAKVIISGAWNWVSPECLCDPDTRPTFASDVYSLGMCIVEALHVVEAVKAGNPKTCMPWRLSDQTAVRHHVKCGNLPSQPKICNESQWALVKRMCMRDPEQRIKISTVVDELAKQVSNIDGNKPAKTAPTELVAQKDLSEVLKSTQKLLGKLRVNSERYDDSIPSLYFVLWDHIKQVHEQIDGMEPIAGCWDAFQAFLFDARALTIKLQTMGTNLVSVAETTMCCYALRRRLNKLCDAYFLDCPNDPGFQTTGLLVGLNTREAEGNEPPPS
ncbi:hypothetical protein PRIC1_011287 [Phytophthora ramorum]